MRIAVDHRFERTFARPVSRVVLALRMAPENTHDQTVARWGIEVACDARLRERTDGYGNRVTTLYADGPLDRVELRVTGEVLTSHSDGVVRGSHETLAPAAFARATELTPPLPEVADWVAGLGGRDRLDVLHRVLDAFHERFGDWEGDEVGTAAAWEADRIGPADRVHLFLTAARAAGVPARFVGGWCASLPGGPAPHRWAEAHVERIGWIGFDPRFGRCPEDAHVRVAVGLDAGGVAPVAG